MINKFRHVLNGLTGIKKILVLSSSVAILLFAAIFSLENYQAAIGQKNVKVIPAPTLISPANQSTTNLKPSFSWTSINKVTAYQFQLTKSTDTAFLTPEINTDIASTNYTLMNNLSLGSYIWHVRGKTSTATGSWSSSFGFTVSDQIVKASTAFSPFNAGDCMADGTIFGEWKVDYSGYGCVKIESDGTTNWLHQAPKASASLSETHASLVTGKAYSGPLTVESSFNTAQQLRTGSSANAWEVAWLIWNFTDNEHFYYFIPKPNGWELGKRDPAYPGGQRFLATGSTPIFSLLDRHTVKIVQDSTNKITVTANGQVLTTFQDTERPYSAGKIGLYNEDAHVHFYDVKATQ